MECYIEKVVTDTDISSDIKTLIPDAGARRRMSKIVKSAVAAAVECIGGVENISRLDAVITATGWGCLTDSERFLRNIIVEDEQLLNPTPFIQSTFNTVGGLIAMLGHNHFYNMTYVNRSHSFEDALLDAIMQMEDGECNNALVGAFDEQTQSQHRIMERMGLFRKNIDGEGAVFAHIVASRSDCSVAKIVDIEFPRHTLTRQDCIKIYATSDRTHLLWNSYEQYGLYPTASAKSFSDAIKLAGTGIPEIIVYNEYLGAPPTVMIIRCV